MSMNFSYSLLLKPIGLTYTLNEWIFFTHAWFRKIMHWSWVKQSSKFWHIIQYEKKSHLLNHYQPHLKRPKLLRSCQAYDAGYRFSESLIFTWKLKLYHRLSEYYQLFFLNWQAQFVHFQENICQIPKTEWP